MRISKTYSIALVVGVLILIGGVAGYMMSRQHARESIQYAIEQERLARQQVEEQIRQIQQERAAYNEEFSNREPISEVERVALEQHTAQLISMIEPPAVKLLTSGLPVPEELGAPHLVYKTTEAECAEISREIDRNACLDNIIYQRALSQTTVRACAGIVSDVLRSVCADQIRTQEALRLQDISLCFSVEGVRRSCYQNLERDLFTAEGIGLCEQYPADDVSECKRRYQDWARWKVAHMGIFASDRDLALKAVQAENVDACPIRRADDTGVHSWCVLEILKNTTGEHISRIDRIALCGLLPDEQVRIATDVYEMKVITTSERAYCEELLLPADTPVSRQSQ